MSRGRRALLAVAAVLGVAATLLPPVMGPAQVQLATAADNRQFRAGNIITDQLFFDGAAMTAAEVQRFLEVKNPNCVAGPDGSPCLKNFRQSTWTRAADAQCPGTYGGASNETAATIIAKVGRACGISQRALLVILQKEQGLVTASGRSLYADRYRKAMGYGCPDTAPCDAQYYGFFNQVYSAAYRYRFYAANPTRYNHRAGQVNQVRYHPDAACGSSSVKILNQATAGLYNYTPYQPNQAALDAGAGEGDRCSAYGNRNFWRYFTDWFGSTQTAGAADLADHYVSTGGADGPLGAVRTPVTCGLLDDGCRQGYANGSIYWSAATGPRTMMGAVGTFYEQVGAVDSPLRYPTRSVSWLPDKVGQYARFQGGAIFWSPGTGARMMMGAVGTHYDRVGGVGGPLKYPTLSVTWLPDRIGQYATFQGGKIFWSPATRARTMTGAVGGFFDQVGGVGSPLRYPTSSVSWLPDQVGQYATFQGGTIFWSPDTGARMMMGAIGAHYDSVGGVTSPLGYPTRSVTGLPDGVGQYARFQHGSIYWSPGTGAHTLLGAIEDAWRAVGAEGGRLGYPTSSVLTAADGTSRYAHFEHGSLWTDGTTVLELGTGVRDAWVAAGADRGRLGRPTSAETAAADGRGRYATFAGGSVHWTAATGAHALWGPIADRWTQAGGAGGGGGELGYPTAGVRPTADGRGEVARFENGSLYSSTGTGVRLVRGAVQRFWDQVGAERSVLGLPVADVSAAEDGVGEVGRFEAGSIWWSSTTGARMMTGAVGRFWEQVGGVRGPLRYPTRSVSLLPDGAGQYATFQGGSIYWSRRTGARTMTGAVGDFYAQVGGTRSPLGYPTRSVSWLPDAVGQYATFQGGTIYWSPGTGSRMMTGRIGAFYTQVGGVDGPLGYPTRSVSWLPDRVGQYADFEHGSIIWSPSTGTRSMVGAIGDLYASTGGPTGSLGYPTRSVSALADGVGRYATFQRGAIWSGPATGAHVLSGAFLRAYTDAGAERGGLAYPTRSAYAVSRGTRMDFEGGTITVSSATGRATVRLR